MTVNAKRLGITRDEKGRIVHGEHHLAVERVHTSHLVHLNLEC